MADYGPDVISDSLDDGRAGADASQARFELSVGRQFPKFLASQDISLTFTTWRSAKLFLLGHRPGDGDGPKVSVLERTFSRCMGLVANKNAEMFYLSTLYQLWRFGSAFEDGNYQGYDRLYVPKVVYTTVDIDIHDIWLHGDGQPGFVNTLFSCLATVSDKPQFRTGLTTSLDQSPGGRRSVSPERACEAGWTARLGDRSGCHRHSGWLA